MDPSELKKRALALHEEKRGKIATQIKIPVDSMEQLSLAYSPGVAEPCRQIAAAPESVYRYTGKGNTIAVVSDGTAVLGLGNIGPEAGLPVMEGKALLFKEFADIDAVPICLKTTSPEQVIEICCALEPNFGGINLEDIRSPHCVTIERALRERLGIPVFHDDQHGTAIVSGAALLNAAKLTGRKLETMRVVLSGMGAAGSAIARLLKALGVGCIYGLNSKGPIYNDGQLSSRYDFVIEELFRDQILDNPAPAERQDLSALIRNTDAFIGVSVGGLLTQDMVQSMKPDPIILAMANPDPEIAPEEAAAAGAAIIGSGRMDYPNQINNVLAFPGIFHGVLRAQRELVAQGLPSPKISEEMKLAATRTLAGILGPEELTPQCILPSPFDSRIVPEISKAVYNVAMKGI